MKARLSLIAAALIAAAPAFAGQKWSLSDWLKSLEGRVRQTEQKQKSQLAATAAIRGNKQEDGAAKKLYWKGKSGQPATPEEMAAFKSALSLAQEGKSDEAQKSFEAFLQKYPNSAMSADAKQTLALLKEPVETPQAQ